jgi:N-acetylmuramoyl-L-alanine amidase
MRWIAGIVLALAAGTATATPTRVLIDPGHGGADDGTVKNHVREADITLTVARKLLALLQHDKSFHASLTRVSDERLSLPARTQLAKDSHADIFLSIHVNSSPDPKAKGAEFYFQNQLPPDEESMFLAHREDALDNGADGPQTYDFVARRHYPSEVAAIVTDLLDSDRIRRSSVLSKDLKLSWRGNHKSQSNSVRQAPFYVLSRTLTPAALVELGFLTNADDYRELTDGRAQDRMARDLYRGLLRYQESITNGHASRQP